ncbi:MAG TPA: hypothetical protein PL131_12550 [Methylotenera sp.]|nr:hypothetical protein [Methylotenera sp.]HPN01918.1 hypothetical protein [Methylotenera sp.]
MINPFELLKIKDLFNLKEWWEDKRYGKNKELRALARRVLKVLDAHRIPTARIQTVFPEFNLQFKDFKNLDSLISILNEQFLEAFSNKFFINREWLETGEGNPQEQFEHGYELQSIYDYLVKLKPSENQTIIAHFIAQTGTEFVPANNYDTHQGLVVALEFFEHDDPKSGFEYSRYQLLYVGYWHYYKTRMMIKAISLVCFKLGFIQKGWFSKYANHQGVEKYLVNEIFDHTNHNSWYPDDYIFTSKRSACSKDDDDAQLFHNHLKEIGFYEKIKRINS